MNGLVGVGIGCGVALWSMVGCCCPVLCPGSLAVHRGPDYGSESLTCGGAGASKEAFVMCYLSPDIGKELPRELHALDCYGGML